MKNYLRNFIRCPWKLAAGPPPPTPIEVSNMYIYIEREKDLHAHSGYTMDPYNYPMNLEYSDFFEFNDWKDDDLPLMISGYPESQNYAANEMVNSGGSNSYHEDPNTSKQKTNNPFRACWIGNINGLYSYRI